MQQKILKESFTKDKLSNLSSVIESNEKNLIDLIENALKLTVEKKIAFLKDHTS